MNLERQVCSLPLAQRLKELGVKQESLFFWKDFGERDGFGVEHRYHCTADNMVNGYSAFTVAELGEMLPRSVVGKDGKRHPKEYRGVNAHGQHIVSYHEDFEPPLETVFADTEADARAKMLIYLLENNLITP